MSDTAASFDEVMLFGGRKFAFGGMHGLSGRFLGRLVMSLAAVAAVGASTTAVVVAGLWMVGLTRTAAPYLQAGQPGGPARLALVDSAAFAKTSFEAKWAVSTAIFPPSAQLAALPVAPGVAGAERANPALETARSPDLKVEHEGIEAAGLTPSIPESRKSVADADMPPIPLPIPNPVRRANVQVPEAEAAPQVAAVTSVPAVEKRETLQEGPALAPALSGPVGRTALYDITGQVVYMPNGERLEAHSGFGHRRDDPSYIKVKNLGPTPPNVYRLTLRERLFHGVRAVRMTPVDESKMFGRDGMLAHSYLLGASGQSNGCVSFKDYDRFLQAFLKGEVDRIVVVRNLDEAPRQLAGLVRAGGRDENRYAATEVTGSTW